jgi:hypothetical protein
VCAERRTALTPKEVEERWELDAEGVSGFARLRGESRNLRLGQNVFSNYASSKCCVVLIKGVELAGVLYSLWAIHRVISGVRNVRAEAGL